MPVFAHRTVEYAGFAKSEDKGQDSALGSDDALESIDDGGDDSGDDDGGEADGDTSDASDASDASDGGASGDSPPSASDVLAAHGDMTEASDDEPPSNAATAEHGLSGGSGDVPYRAEMEHAFGRSFADVRAFTGGSAQAATDALGAEAYAVGKLLAFRDSSPSKETVVHELVHVVQQARGGAVFTQAKGGVSSPDDRHEREADSIASAVVGGAKAGAIQEIPEAGGIHRKVNSTPGNQYEIKVRLANFNRVSVEGTLSVSKKDYKAISGKTAVGDGDAHAGFQLLKTKASVEVDRASGKWSEQLAVALGNVEIADTFTLPGFPELTAKADISVFEGKLDTLASTDKFDLDVAKIQVSIEGKAPDILERFGANVSQEDRKQLEIKVAIKAKVSLTLADVARIREAWKAARKMAKHAKELVKARRELAAAAKQARALEKQLAVKGRKRLVGKARDKIVAKLTAAKAKSKTLKAALTKSGNAYRAAEKVFAKAAGGLKKGAAKLAQKALVKGASKLIAKIGAKLIPGLNIVSTLADLYSLGKMMLSDSKPGNGDEDVGGDSEDGTSTTKGGTGTGDATDATKKPDAGAGDAHDRGSTDGRAQDDGAKNGGTSSGDAQNTSPSGAPGPAGTTDDGTATSGEDGGVAEGEETAVDPHAGTKAVLDMLGTAPGSGGSLLRGEDIAVLNDMIPQDLTKDELAKLRAQIHTGSGDGADIYELAGSVREKIEAIRHGDPEPEMSINDTDHTDILTDGKDPEDAAPALPPMYGPEPPPPADQTTPPFAPTSPTEPTEPTEPSGPAPGNKPDDGPPPTLPTVDPAKPQDPAKKPSDKTPTTADKGKDTTKKPATKKTGGTKDAKPGKKPPKPPTSVLPFEPMLLIRFDEPTKAFVWKDRVDGLMNREYKVSGLTGKLVAKDLSFSKQPDGGYMVYVSLTTEVLGVPANVEDDYPYKVGQQKVEAKSYYFNFDEGIGGEVTSIPKFDSQVRSALVKSGTGWKPKAAGVTIDIDQSTLRIDEVVSSSPTTENGTTTHVVTVRYTPTKVKKGHHMTTSNGMTKLKVGTSIVITASFTEGGGK